jgi:replication-associated recombination protein RarA
MQKHLFNTEKFSNDNLLPHEQDNVKASKLTNKTSPPRNDYRNPKTINNYDLDCVVSALQKSVRRGQEELALFWMDEMIDSGYINYFWRRMSVIVVEDIGLANPFAVTVISSLYSLNEKFIKKKINEKLQCTMAVLYLCRSNKSHEVDHALDYLELRKQEGWRPEIPPEAIDKHTRLGKELLKQLPGDYEKNGLDKFFYEGILLNTTLTDTKYKQKVWKKRNLRPELFNKKY